MRKMILAAMALLFIGACSAAPDDLKSPCVGDKGSPCDRRAVNDNVS